MRNEFKIGQKITLDRYNHIEDVIKTKIVAFVAFNVFKPEVLDGYLFIINGTKIVTRNMSIMESKNYTPVDAKDRHTKEGVTIGMLGWN